MVTVIAECNIAEDKLEVAKPFYEEVVAYTRKQQGCVFYDVYQDRSKSTSIVFIERWAEDMDLQAHLNDPVFLQMYKHIELCFAEDEIMKEYDLFI